MCHEYQIKEQMNRQTNKRNGIENVTPKINHNENNNNKNKNTDIHHCDKDNRAVVKVYLSY